MLILKKIKLDELYKFGFTQNNGKYEKIETIELSKNREERCRAWIIEEKNGEWVINYNKGRSLDTLYDLIQAGLVEKVVK